MIRRLVIGGALLAAALAVAVACGEGKTPSKTGGGDGGGDSTAPATRKPSGPSPQIVSRSRGGMTTVVGAYGITTAPALPGITVQFTEKSVLPAGLAFAVVSFTPKGPVGPGGGFFAAADLAKLKAALSAAGFLETDVRNDMQYGPFGIIRVKVPLADRAAASKKVFEIIENAVGRPDQTGVQFALADCGPALEPVRRAALKGAEAKAKAIASAGGLSLGAIVATNESPMANPYGPPATDPCDPATEFQYKGMSSLQSVEATPEVNVTVNMTVTFSTGTAPGAPAPGGITTTGLGRVTAVADRAYVVVFTNPKGGPTGPKPMTDREKDSVIDAVKSFGVRKEDIVFAPSPYGAPAAVAVAVSDLVKAGKEGRDIANAIEDALGDGISKGMLFTHSRCGDVLDEARKEAFADARDRAERLAGSTGAKLGKGFRSLLDAGTASSPYGGPPVSDPCDPTLSYLVYGGYSSAAVKAFDAKPEFEVSAALQVTFTTE
jgi:uncharacterized protein YggE